MRLNIIEQALKKNKMASEDNVKVIAFLLAVSLLFNIYLVSRVNDLKSEISGGSGQSADSVTIGDIVEIDYIGKYVNGTLFDTSIEDVALQNDAFDPYRTYEPIMFRVGDGMMIPGFEESVFGIQGAGQLTEKLRNWASSYNAWVTILDDHGKPNNGPFDADPTIITLNPRTLRVTYRFDYYMYGQFMKFVERGARRVDSGPNHRSLRHVAFINPDETAVVIVVNLSGSNQAFALEWKGQGLAAELPGLSVGTYRWPTQSNP